MTALRSFFAIVLFSVFFADLACDLQDLSAAELLLRPAANTYKTSSGNLTADWLKRAVEEANSIEDAYWRSIFLWRIAEAQFYADDLAGAMTTAQAITDAKKRVLAYADIAKAQARNGNFAAAKSVAEFVRSDQRHYLDILKTVADLGGFEEAEDMAKVHNNMDYKAHAYFFIAKAYAHKGNVAKAKKLANKLKHSLSSSFQSMIYVSIAESYAKVGNWEEYEESIKKAKALAKSNIVDRRACPYYYIYYQIVETQVNIRDFSGAIKTADAISDAYYKSLAYKAIVTGMSDVNDITNAKKIVARISKSNLKDSAYLSILKAQINLGNFKGAESTAKLIPGKNARYKALREISIARGDFKAARVIADSLEKPDSSAYRQIALAQAKAGNLNGYRETIRLAIETAKAYKDLEYTSMPPRKPTLFNSIVHVQVDAGDFEGAIDTAALISIPSNAFSSDVRNSAFEYIAKGLVRAGEITCLQTWINSLPDPPGRIAALLGAARASSPKGTEKAQDGRLKLKNHQAEANLIQQPDL